jgi:two-component system OmpR family response regulator
VPDSLFQFRGDLGEQPLPEILQTIYHHRVPGVVTAARDGIEKKIFVQDGTVIFATSTERADSLGAFLKRTNRITTSELRISAESLLTAQGKRHGQLLVEMGVLTEDQLYGLVTEQVRSILYSIFEWEKGDVSFEVGQYRTDELIQLNVPVEQSILEGIKLLQDARRVVSRLGPSWTVFERTELVPDPAVIPLSTAELRFLEQIDGARTLRELVNVGPADPGLNAKIVYAFLVLRLVARRDATMRSGIRKIQWKTGGSGFDPVPGS